MLDLALSPLGEKIFLDRYSRKDPVGVIPVGARVLYSDPHTRQKEVGVVTSSGVEMVQVQTAENGTASFRRDQVDFPLESVREAHERVARAAAGDDAALYDKFFRVLSQSEFVPAGRILGSLGSKHPTTSANCFVLPCPHDSRQGILTALGQMTELMCKGGGVGINYSSLRPQNAYVSGVNGRSSGAVSWMELFSFMTNLIIQGGSRRGAQMAMMAVWHPDVLRFIDLKRDNSRATGCNMSVVVSDDFMAAVKTDSDWVLRFPDTSHSAYDELWDGDLGAWEGQGLPVVAWGSLPARELWSAIVSSAHACAEPGVWFVDRANFMRPAGSRLVATNPCGEQGLPGYSVCNLGHIYLPALLSCSVWDSPGAMGPVDSFRLEHVVRTAVRFLDRVVSVATYPLPETAARQRQERRVGLGTLGLGEYLVRRGVRYGSDEAVQVCDELYRRIAYYAYDESTKIAAEEGCCPCWSAGRWYESGFGGTLHAHFPELYERVLEHGLRNVTLLTQAPTGTVGTMLGTSTGIEPYYLLEWQRNSRLGSHVERASVVSDYRRAYPDGPLPDYFVTAMDLSPHEHVRMQAAVQKWTDASISKTINMPHDATVEDVSDVYMELYDSGCKGGTIYRDGSRQVQVLEAVPEAPKPEKAPPKPRVVPRTRPSVTSSRNTPAGKVHVHLTLDEEGGPLEVFCDSGRAGSEVHALMEAMGRLASLVLRVDDDMSPRERMLEIVRQLRGIGGSNSVGLGPEKVLSIADGVGLALLDAWVSCAGEGSEDSGPAGLDLCPQCDNATLQKASGCESCLSCGYSRC